MTSIISIVHFTLFCFAKRN